MNCIPHEFRECTGGECIIVIRCKICLRPFSKKYPNAKRNCGMIGETHGLPYETAEEIKHKAEAKGILLGDAIAAMTKAIGIQPCGGCDKRRQWLNAAHQWVKNYFSDKS